MTGNILAVDDEEGILRIIKRALEKDGCQVDTVSDPLLLKNRFLGKYDLILLDVMMPGVDGFSLCRRIRGEVDCPILFLTARTGEEDIMTGLGLGGDDYIRKPFGIGELRSRVQAHIRRERRRRPMRSWQVRCVSIWERNGRYTGRRSCLLQRVNTKSASIWPFTGARCSHGSRSMNTSLVMTVRATARPLRSI